MYLVLDDVESCIVLGQQKNISRVSLQSQHVGQEGFGWNGVRLLDVGIDGLQEDLGRLEASEETAEVSLDGIGDLGQVGFQHFLLDVRVDHLDEAVEVPQAKVLSVLFAVDRLVATGQLVDNRLHQLEDLLVLGANSLGDLDQVSLVRNSS